MGSIYIPERPSLTLPSYHAGFARTMDESANPSLWKGLAGAWVPELGPTGGTLHDVSGMGNDGTLTNMDPGTDWVASKNGWALDFDGVDDYVDCGGSVQFSDPNTLSMIVNSPLTSSRRTLIGHNDEASVVQLETTNIDSERRVQAIIPGMYTCQSTLFTQIHNSAYSIAYIRRGSGTSHEIWLDGEALSLEINAANAYSQPTNNTEIGRRASGSQVWDRQIHSVLIYSRALSTTEIRHLYRDPLAPFRLRKRVLFKTGFTLPPSGIPISGHASAIGSASINATRAVKALPIAGSSEAVGSASINATRAGEIIGISGSSVGISSSTISASQSNQISGSSTSVGEASAMFSQLHSIVGRAISTGSARIKAEGGDTTVVEVYQTLTPKYVARKYIARR